MGPRTKTIIAVYRDQFDKVATLEVSGTEVGYRLLEQSVTVWENKSKDETFTQVIPIHRLVTLTAT